MILLYIKGLGLVKCLLIRGLSYSRVSVRGGATVVVFRDILNTDISRKLLENAITDALLIPEPHFIEHNFSVIHRKDYVGVIDTPFLTGNAYGIILILFWFYHNLFQEMLVFFIFKLLHINLAYGEPLFSFCIVIL